VANYKHGEWILHTPAWNFIIGSSRLPGHLPGNRKVPGLMLSWGFQLLLFLWARNFTCLSHPAVKPETYCIV